MDTTGPSALEIILWVLLANALLLLTAYGLVAWWRKRTQDSVVYIGEEMQDYAGRIGEVLAFLQEFESTTAEPYVSQIIELKQEVEDVSQQAIQLQAENQALYAEMSAASTNKLQGIINAPYHWFLHWRRSETLRQHSKVVNERLSTAEGQVKHIYELPWEIASKAREIERQIVEMARLSQELRQKGLRGKPLFAALSQVPALQATLKSVPGTFIHANQEDLLAAASLEDTINTFNAVRQLQPDIDKWLPPLREWGQAYKKAMEEHTATQQAISSLRQSLAHPPGGLQGNPLSTRLDIVAAQSNGLAARLAQPEVDQLKSLQREATRLRRLLEDAGQQFSRAVQQASELGQALTALVTGIDSLSTQMASLEKHPAFPLVWDESGNALSALRVRMTEIGPPNRPRTPEEIKALLDESAQMKARQNELSAHFPKASEQHAALVSLLESADLKGGASWVRKTRELVAQAVPYDPKNWPKQDTLTSLQSELDNLAALQERLVPADRPAQVKESSLAERLKETQQLASQHKALHPRVESLRARLEKIQALEAEGKEKLTSAWNALERVAILAESNNLLREMAADEIKRLSEELKNTAKEMNEQGQGLIEKKLQRVQSETASVSQAMNGWLASVSSEITSLVRQLNDRLIELDGITGLEDGAIKEARSLLARDDVRSEHTIRRMPTGPLGRKTLSEQDASVALKRKNDLLVTMQSALQALTAVSEPLLVTYKEAVTERNQALERLAELAERFPQRRAWPPINQTPIPDEQGLPALDERWEALKKQRHAADAALGELRRLQQQYHQLADRAGQVLDRIAQDQERITEVEDKIEDLQQAWQLMAQSTPDNLLLIQGVQQLLSKTDSQLAFIRQQYMRGALDYGTALRSLQLLNDEIFTARVPVDEQSDTGLVTQHPRAGTTG
jgi:predicted  nucleic acid-binding Zn-ribbon protein